MRRGIAVFLSWFALALSAAWALPTAQDIEIIRGRFAAEGLSQADVRAAADGRLELTGQFRDRAQVQLAFHIAQMEVGVRWVAPTTPSNVRYPGTENMKRDILEALRRSSPKRTEASPPKLYALLVGVGHYGMPLPAIPNAADDAKTFYNFLDSRNVDRKNITLLLEERATKSEVESALARIGAAARADDTVLLFFSTHGTKPNDLGNTSIVLYDTVADMQRHWIDPKTTLQDDDIRNFIEHVAPARVMVVLDVCYSGGAFAKIPGFLASSSKDLFNDEETYSTGMGQTNLSYVAGRKDDQQKLLVAASGPGEKSWNNPEFRNGYFTYYFVRELQRRNDVVGAFSAAKPQVERDVREKVSAQEGKKVTQTPQASFIPSGANVKF